MQISSNTNDTQPPLKRVRLNDEIIKQECDEKQDHKLMHLRNIYQYNKPEFYQLSSKSDFFKGVLKENNESGDYYINSNHLKSNVMLTKALLKHDFNSEFQHPRNHLCRPITQRLNYILWI